jgi:hypothetical protein
MPRTRYLKPDFFKDEDIAVLPHWIRLLYQGLWILADKEGRLQDRPLWIKAEIFPYEKVDIEKGLNLLSKTKQYGKYPFIQRYTDSDNDFIQILKWSEHQKPHHQEPASKFPNPPPFLKEKESNKEKEKTLTNNFNFNYNYKEASTTSPKIFGESPNKIKYLDFVMLYKDEHQKLTEKLGNTSLNQIIDDLNNYIGSTGRKYKSHYHTILSWYKKNNSKQQDKFVNFKSWLSKNQK